MSQKKLSKKQQYSRFCGTYTKCKECSKIIYSPHGVISLVDANEMIYQLLEETFSEMWMSRKK